MTALNQEQLNAVTHFNGPCLVIAGPGSGKTTVIINRVLYLIIMKKIVPKEILVITFTKAAAVEMKSRFLNQIKKLENKEDMKQVTFCTFHSLFFLILKQAKGYTGENIITQKEKSDLFRQIISIPDINLLYSEDLLERFLAEVSCFKNSQSEITKYQPLSFENELFIVLFQSYENLKKEEQKIDFDDMVLDCINLLKTNKRCLYDWQKRFSFFMIDEFQDINHLQYMIIQLLIQPNNNLFVVGDDDQSIYSFRGSKPEIMLSFPNVFQKHLKIELPYNYRSTDEILKYSNLLISNNKNRFSKIQTTDKKARFKISLYEFISEKEEVKNIINYIEETKKRDEKLNNIAILFRTNQEAKRICNYLEVEDIPFQYTGYYNDFFSHFIIKDFISYLSFAFLEQKREFFFGFMNKPKRYISRKALTTEYVDFSALIKYYQGNESMKKRIRELEYHTKQLKNMNLYAAINYIRKGIGYESYLEEIARNKKFTFEDKSLIEDWKQIMDRLQESAKKESLFKNWLEKYSGKELESRFTSGNEDNCVTICTMHGSKGLEYHTVIIPGLNEGNIPYGKGTTYDNLEEERRLLYVAMTRAKERLILTYVNENRDSAKQKSRFIDEIFKIE